MTSGFLPNPFDHRDAWEDEILSGETPPLPASFRTELKFEPQGSWPFCVSFCTTKMMEEAIKRQEGVVWDLSQPWLFFQSGGSRVGSFFRANLETAVKKGEVSFATLPMPSDLWDTASFEEVRANALKTQPDADKRVPGYVRIAPDRESIKKAIYNYGMVMVGVYAGGGYWKDRTLRQGDEDNHATLLVGWDSDDAWIAFDSLQPSKDFDGYHKLSKDYTFSSVYAITGLPEDWRKIRDEAREAPANNANRYGKPRDYGAEVAFAAKMLEEFKRFKNQSVLDAAGRFWEMYIRAGVYGGYSLSYTKWGMWQPGDLINDCYLYRRTGQHAFNFDKKRNEY